LSKKIDDVDRLTTRKQIALSENRYIHPSYLIQANMAHIK